MSGRDLDVVVLGATGVTGRRVAAYLDQRGSETGLRWAAAARSTEKLDAMLRQIGASAPELLAADVSDRDSLATIAQRATVVLDLVGPYTLYGRPVIEACVAGGAHYVDLTGELPFVREILASFDGPAREAGVKIVQVCGFEALPPDLLVALADDSARRRFGEGLAAADLVVSVTPPPGMPRPSDSVSGGTFQSLSVVAGAEDAAAITDPALLVTDRDFAERVRSVSPIPLAPRRGPDGTVLAPMAPAAFINPAIIHRSAALRAEAAGRAPEAFRYREAMALAGSPASLPARWALAGALSATQVGLRALARARPAVRRPLAATMARVGPASGFGPAGDRLEGWSWSMSVDGRTAGGREVRTTLEADGHPGYLATARLLGEAGILLAEDGATPAVAGCLTPAAALGTDCVPRFSHARLRFSAGD